MQISVLGVLAFHTNFNEIKQGRKRQFAHRKIVHKAALIKMVKVLSGDMEIGGVESWLEEHMAY